MKPASLSGLWLVLILCVTSLTACGREMNGVPRVGVLRQFDHFVFRGNAAFSAWSLWWGLNATYHFPEVSHPLAPRGPFLKAIGSQLQLGYEHCGFPDARVKVYYDASRKRVIVQIHEGFRYRCGRVQVLGARLIPVHSLVVALTQTNRNTAARAQAFQFQDNAPANRKPAAKPDADWLWVPGRPAAFDDIERRFLANRVKKTLVQNGFFFSRFSLNVVTNTRPRLALLQIKIRHEGPPAKVARIKVVGNHRNTRQAILHYLDLKRGMRYTQQLAATLNNRLYHSARFLTNWVSIGTPSAAGKVALTLHVVESKGCPALGQKFKPNEQAFLNARNWLAHVAATHEDAVLTFSGYPDQSSELKFIFSPRQGLLLLQSERRSGRNQLRQAVLLATNQIALYDLQGWQKFVARNSIKQIKSRLNLETQAPSKNGNCAKLTFATGFNHQTNAAPWVFTLSLAPAAFVQLAHSTNFTCWREKNQLLLSNSVSLLKLNARTGRFIAFTMNNPHPPHHRLWLRFQSHAFTPAVERVERDGAGFENSYNTNAPFGSLVGFCGGELVQLPFIEPILRAKLPAITCAELPTLLHLLGTGKLFTSFQKLLHATKTPTSPAGKFLIPEVRRPMPKGTVRVWLLSSLHGLLASSDALLPVGSWPWTLARDVAFIYRGQEKYVRPDLEAVYRAQTTGPLGCLAAAQLLQSLHSPLAKVAAAQGLKRLSTADFENDCRLLLDQHQYCGRVLAAMADTLRQLNAVELDGLTAPLPAAPAAFLRDSVRRLRTTKAGQPLFKTLAPALKTYWQIALKQQVARRLQRIAQN